MKKDFKKSSDSPGRQRRTPQGSGESGFGKFMKDKPTGGNERGGNDRGGNDRRDDGRGPREGGDRKPYGERSGGSSYGGDRKPFDGERKPYGERSSGSSYGGERKPYGDRKPFDGDRKPYGERSGGSSYGGDRKPFDGERKPYGERSSGGSYGGERKPFEGERKPYGERSSGGSNYGGERKPYGDRKPFDGERKPFDGERKPYSDRSSGGSSYGGERKPYGDRKPFDGDRKPYGDRKPFDGERKPYGERSGGSNYGGERKPYGERKPFDGERKPYGERSGGYPKRSEGFSKPGGYIKRGEAPNDQREAFKSRQGGGDRNNQSNNNDNDRDWNANLDEQGRGDERERKPFNADNKPFARVHKPYGGERKPYDERKKERDSRVEAPVDGEAQSDSDEKKNDFERSERPNQREFNAERPNRNEKPDRRVGDLKYAPNYDFERMAATLPPKKRAKMERPDTDEIRLNRFIANAGVCSRREADGLIGAGQVTVNGKVVNEMGYRVAMSDVVKYGNKVLNGQKMVYILLNKPKDYITTTDDPQDRHTIMELIAGACEERVYPVGRLDRNTTGLLLLTNDGALAEKLTHPSYETHKIYQVELDKPMTNEHFEAMKAGVELEDGKAKPDSLSLVTPDAEVIGIEIHSGRNRIVRRMFEHFGYEVSKLDRTVFAGLDKKTLPRGKWRFLTEREVVKLKFMS